MHNLTFKINFREASIFKYKTTTLHVLLKKIQKNTFLLPIIIIEECFFGNLHSDFLKKFSVMTKNSNSKIQIEDILF